MTSPTVLVTTSWDDGHVLDRVLAERLSAHGLPASFYVAPRSVELPPAERLDPSALRDLSERFEIGGHTLTHRPLPGLSADDAEAEIRNGKEELEDVIGKPLRSFCYPCGQFSPVHVRQVRAAGFVVARTVERFATGLPGDLLRMPTTVHAHRHRRDVVLVSRIARRPAEAARLHRDWSALALALFERVRRTGGVFHLWGHSWEIDQRGEWAQLDRVLAHIGGRTDVTYVTNGELAARTPDRPGTPEAVPGAK